MAQHAGVMGSGDAMARSSSVNQLLGTHVATEIYQGNPILTPTGTGGNGWGYHLDAYDLAQPFTLSGTSIGRVTIPLLAVGNGADLIVTLFANNAGVPGNTIQRTRIPAAWIQELSAVNALTGPNTSVILEYSGNPLATGEFNDFNIGATATTGWPYPTSGTGGPASGPISTYYPNYFIQMGGNNGTTFFSDVYTIQYATGSNGFGSLNAAVPQPALPAPHDGSGAAVVSVDPSNGNLTLVLSGGSQVSGGGAVNAVYAAAFNANTGVVSAWSTQTSLPAAFQWHSMAAWNGYVYVLAGTQGSVTNANTVYYAQVQNGQVGAWTQTSSLPLGFGFAFAAAINGFLFICGGFNNAPINTVYYAPINANGTLGAWQTAPPLPSAVNALNGLPCMTADNNGLVINGAGKIMTLGVTTNGPDIAWQYNTVSAGGNFFAIQSKQDGDFIYYGILGTTFLACGVHLTPRISVPLPATGLTNGATYFISVRQQNGNPGSYLRVMDDFNVFPGNPSVLKRLNGTSSWVIDIANHAIPIQVFDTTQTGSLWHSYEDNGARLTTMVNATTPDQRLLGVCEAVVNPTQLNINSGFEETLYPWAIGATGTLVRTNTRAYEGQYSAQVTPNGTSANVFFQSEYLACVPGQQVTVSMWVYAVNTITNNFSATLFWYDNTITFLSESDNLVTIPAGQWTFVTNTFTAPAGAYFLSINPRQSGTPPVGNVFNVDQAIAYDPTCGPQLASVLQYVYPSTWTTATPSPWPPTGTAQLA